MKLLKTILYLTITVSLAACSVKAHMKKGDKHYESGRYASSRKTYQKAYKKSEDKEQQAQIALKIGKTFDLVNNPNKAASWYRKATFKKDSFSDAILSLAFTEIKNQRLEKAEESFTEYQNLKPDDEKSEEGLEILERIKEWTENPARYTVQPIKHLNSSSSDFSPAYMRADTNVILFASTRTEKRKGKKDAVTGVNRSNIFESRYTNKVERKKKKGKKRKKTSSSKKTTKYRWSAPNNAGDSINSRFHEGAISFNAKGDVMYFTSSRKVNSKNYGTKIYSAKKADEGWGEVALLGIVPDSLSAGHPSVSDDGKTIYFTSDMPGGIGGNDIWMAKGEGGWSNPVNLGKEINTEGNEMFPFIRKDGVLFFSSDTHTGMGGLDIFKAEKDEQGKWNVENMKYPINSPTDDFGIVFKQDEKKGMFTSSRKRGRDNIFSFEFIPYEFKYQAILINSYNDKPLGNVGISMISSQGDKALFKTDKNGSFNMDLKPETEYVFMFARKNFLNGRGEASTLELTENKTFIDTIYLNLIKRPIELPNIFYDFASTNLREDSKTALNKLIETLKDNPKITIELGSHSDMVGDEDANQKLSLERALSVINYLVSKGIQPDRLVARGYGESLPKTINDKLVAKYNFLEKGQVLNEYIVNQFNEEQQEILNQINRRTEFRVLSTDYKPLIIETEEQK